MKAAKATPDSDIKKPPRLLHIEDFDNFRGVRDIPPESIGAGIMRSVSELNEKEELEPYLRSILFDPSATPHGPVEIADILTHKVTVSRESGIAAFIIKGKSYRTVRPVDVSHQIYRLEKLSGLQFAVFAATGSILDAAKEQFCSTCVRLGCGFAIFDIVDLARLFVAYGFLCPRDGSRIVAGRCKCGYSPKKRILNLLQVESLKALNRAHSIGQRAGLVILPTGGGKTRIAAEDAGELGAASVLYVAHTHEILDVAQSEYEAVFNPDEVTRHFDASSLRSLNRVNITTIQLLAKHLDAVAAGSVDYMVVDEFHHAAARSYRKLIDSCKPSFLLGLTATPFRADRQDILSLCNDNVLVNFELRVGIDSGILCPYHYFGCFDDIDYSSIHHNGVKYSVRDLERALVIPERDAAIAAKWRELADGKPTIAFCCSHRHADRVAKSFTKADIPAEPYLSHTTRDVRERLLQKLSDGDLRVLCTVDVLNEGADMPFVECLLFLRPTESQRIFYQQLGRGLRRYVGKSHCTVIDFIGNFKNAYRIVGYHGLLPLTDQEATTTFTQIHHVKELLNLPLGCRVQFEDRVVDIFARQTLDPRYATRHNIARILVYQYEQLARKLGRKPKTADVNRNLILGTEFYRLVFGSWQAFKQLMEE